MNRTLVGKTEEIRGTILVSTLLVVAFLATGRPAWCGDGACVDNGTLRITVDPQHGQLTEFVDVKTGFNHVATVPGRGRLWEMEVVVNGIKHVIVAEEAKHFSAESLVAGRKGLRLVWKELPGDYAKDMTVEATVELQPGQPMSRWTIAVTKSAGVAVNLVRFPCVVGVAKRERERLAVPINMGQEAVDPRTFVYSKDGKPYRLGWDYPGTLSMQFAAWYGQDGPGLYVACDDASALRKSLAFWGDRCGQANLGFVHYPENQAAGATQYTVPYGVRLGAFLGDWVTAAERYRAWGTEQPWARASRFRCGQIAPWALNTGLWVWNRGKSPGVLPAATALQDKLGLPVSVLWHWWHGCAYDTGYPEYLPPREGSQPFRTVVAEVRRKGLHTMVYMAQRAWGMTTRSWLEEKAEPFAVKREDGSLYTVMPNSITRAPIAVMCMATPFWRNKYAGLAQEACCDLGVDGVYMDVACRSVPCFDPSHGHSLNGGNYWMRGFGELATDIRKRCDRERSIVLGGEDCGETWLPYLDLMLTLQPAKERYLNPANRWEIIPIFHAVYHRYAVCYGNYSTLTAAPYDELWPAERAPKEPMALLDAKFARQFCLEQARALVWGQQSMIANFRPQQFVDRPDEIAYLMRLARVRSRALKYLLHGDYLRAPTFDAPEATSEFSHIGIYSPQDEPVRTFTKRHPLALAGAWRATDGSTAVAVASVADEPLTLTLRFDPDYHGLKAGQAIWRIDEKGREELGRWKAGQKDLSIVLPPLEAWVIEFISP